MRLNPLLFSVPLLLLTLELILTYSATPLGNTFTSLPLVRGGNATPDTFPIVLVSRQIPAEGSV